MKTWFGVEMSTAELQEYIAELDETKSITIARCPICCELFEDVTTECYQNHLKTHLT